jgi:hypothetical protein
MAPASGPTVLGIDVVMVATGLAAVATFAVLVAIYAATTVRDPMAKRVKALNERREQLKAGIVASTSRRRKKITNKNEAADRVRNVLGSMKMLQDEQVEKAQKKLAQAGVRAKDLAFVVIFARFVMPLVIGAVVITGVYFLDWFPEWGSFKKYGAVAGSLIGAYKAPDIYLKNRIQKRSHAIRKGLPDALDLLVICARRPHRRCRLQPRGARTGQGISRAWRRVRADLDRARLLDRPSLGFREPRHPHRSRGGPRRGYDHGPDGEIWYSAGECAARPFRRIPQ